jgi:hypothetical protein
MRIAKSLFASSPCMQITANNPKFATFLKLLAIFSEYAERMKNTQKERRIHRKKFSLSTMPGDFKGTVFQKNLMRSSILA